jgi:hypothetical protein
MLVVVVSGGLRTEDPDSVLGTFSPLKKYRQGKTKQKRSATGQKKIAIIISYLLFPFSFSPPNHPM